MARSAREFNPADVAVDEDDNTAMVKNRPIQYRTHRELCPVLALLAYVAQCSFVFRDGLFLTRNRLVKAVQSVLQLAGIGHSSRTPHLLLNRHPRFYNKEDGTLQPTSNTFGPRLSRLRPQMSVCRLTN